MTAKLAYWSPILNENAPEGVILPDVFQGNTLMLDDKKIIIKGDENDPSHTYLWIPSIKTVTGGVIAFDRMADTKSDEARKTWLKTLEGIKGLHPSRIIPGHFLNQSSQDS